MQLTWPSTLHLSRVKRVQDAAHLTQHVTLITCKMQLTWPNTLHLSCARCSSADPASYTYHVQDAAHLTQHVTLIMCKMQLSWPSKLHLSRARCSSPDPASCTYHVQDAAHLTQHVTLITCKMQLTWPSKLHLSRARCSSPDPASYTYHVQDAAHLTQQVTLITCKMQLTWPNTDWRRELLPLPTLPQMPMSEPWEKRPKISRLSSREVAGINFSRGTLTERTVRSTSKRVGTSVVLISTGARGPRPAGPPPAGGFRFSARFWSFVPANSTSTGKK